MNKAISEISLFVWHVQSFLAIGKNVLHVGGLFQPVVMQANQLQVLGDNDIALYEVCALVNGHLKQKTGSWRQRWRSTPTQLAHDGKKRVWHVRFLFKTYWFLPSGFKVNADFWVFFHNLRRSVWWHSSCVNAVLPNLKCQKACQVRKLAISACICDTLQAQIPRKFVPLTEKPLSNKTLKPPNVDCATTVFVDMNWPDTL